jgi:geranyl-CoA carboxylase alpha subunit
MSMLRQPFRTVLVANRGEIAVRVMRTAQRLGYRTTAVYSDADRDAPHCRAASLALRIGAAQPADSYLNQAALLDAARRGGAQAVHPGYGFLAENADFAQSCLDAGLVFIGPPPQAMRAMGNKAGAKRLMLQAGVPCIPGYEGEDQSEQRMAQEAARIGYPVMVKAAAGGGGRGMRRVDAAADFAEALRSARSEALHAFGNGELILEKALLEPRHIEIQVFADAHGNVVHMGERDCSVQRRHQKLIEESPSPAVSSDLRARMGEVAVSAARAIGYCGAGTLEFLLDREGGFYFMEMNTRLQVEHAVTEAVLGIDLVEWQLRVAVGEALPLSQAQLDERRAAGGHAIEVRLCAEDAQRGFLPQSGTVVRWRAPSGVRTDHALADGMEVPPFYDSMLAKIVAHGRDREDALRRMVLALEECQLMGVRSNRHFLARCVAHPEFAAGRATTAFIEQCLPVARRSAARDVAAATTAAASANAFAAASGLAAEDASGFASDPIGGLQAQVASGSVRLAAAALLSWRRAGQQAACFPVELRNWSSSYAYSQPCNFMLNGVPGTLPVRALGLRDWEIGGQRVSVLHGDGECLVLDAGGETLRILYAPGAQACYFVLDGVDHVAEDVTYAAPRRAGNAAGGDGRIAASMNGRIAAPMNGRVAAVPVAQGAQVRAGQVVLMIEAMKMEHSITAPFDGVVQSMSAREGDQVAPGQLLLEMAATPPAVAASAE